MSIDPEKAFIYFLLCAGMVVVILAGLASILHTKRRRPWATIVGVLLAAAISAAIYFAYPVIQAVNELSRDRP